MEPTKYLKFSTNTWIWNTHCPLLFVFHFGKNEENFTYLDPCSRLSCTNQWHFVPTIWCLLSQAHWYFVHLVVSEGDRVTLITRRVDPHKFSLSLRVTSFFSAGVLGLDIVASRSEQLSSNSNLISAEYSNNSHSFQHPPPPWNLSLNRLEPGSPVCPRSWTEN